MKTRAAVLWDVGQPWSIEELELDDPGPGEVLVEMKVAGLCHSDEHVLQGDMAVANADAEAFGMPPMFPLVGGHEGAGVVVALGEGVRSVAVGDHVAASFIPSCGRCHWCSTGQQILCDVGAKIFEPGMITDGRVAHHIGGQEANAIAKLGTFAEHMLTSEDSLVKVDPDLPWGPAAVVSCGVATGWGSAVHRAEVRSGDTVVVVGVGGIGINAVQGARMAGAKVVDLAPAAVADPVRRHLPPLALLEAGDDLRVMREEIFGPLLPVLPYRDLDEAIRYVNQRPRPLALYYFDSERRHIERVLNETVSGGVTINDTILHIAQDDLPFGGVGPSGMGCYHGFAGFETFSVRKAVFRQSRLSGIGLFKPPYGALFDRLTRIMLR